MAYLTKETLKWNKSSYEQTTNNILAASVCTISYKYVLQNKSVHFARENVPARTGAMLLRPAWKDSHSEKISVQNSRKLKAWKEKIATTSNSSIVGDLQCHFDCSLVLFIVCSRSGSSTASSYFLQTQLSAFLEGFFIVMILLLGSGETLMKCYESEGKNKNSHKNYHHSLLIMW